MFLVEREPESVGGDRWFELTDGRLDTNYFVLGIQSGAVDCDTGAFELREWGRYEWRNGPTLEVDESATVFEGTVARGYGSGTLDVGDGQLLVTWSATQQ